MGKKADIKIKKTEKVFLKKLKNMRTHHKVIFTLTGVTGVVMVWRGLWAIFDSAHPILSNPVSSLILGFVLVGISGIFYSLAES